jgi:PAS domain S-box-containing protein
LRELAIVTTKRQSGRPKLALAVTLVLISATTAHFALTSQTWTRPIVMLLAGLTIAVLMYVVTGAHVRTHAATEAIAAKLRKSEEALRESEERMRLTMAQALDAVITSDTEGRITSWNPNAELLFGWTPEEAIGQRLSETIVPPSHREAHERGIARFLATGEGPVMNRRIELTALHRNGTEFPVELTITAIRMRGVTVFAAFLRDIRERRHAEEARQLRSSEQLEVVHVAERRRREQALQSSEAWKASILDVALDAIITIDRDGRVIEFNPAAERLFGLTHAEAIGRELKELIVSSPAGEGQLQTLLDSVATGEGLLLNRRIELIARRRDGGECAVELALIRIPMDGPPMFTAFLRDLSDQRRAEAELERQRGALHQSEKLAAMGGLLAGVAHELNNPLSIVLGQAWLLRKEVVEGPLTKRVKLIEEETGRCARIVRRFLALARQQPPERHEIDLNQVVREAVELLTYQLRVDDVPVDLELAPDLPRLVADSHQLHQVLVNLIANAHHAMRAAPPPRRLTIRSVWDPRGERVKVTVSDTGPGIPPELQSRIFEPFFTTKPLGSGTGLGLTLCQGIVESHHGKISLASEPGHGATFEIELPLGSMPVAQPEQMVTGEPVKASRILVVDDEPEVAHTLAELLVVQGHHVTTAPNGRVALEKLQTGRFDLILCDIRMPELDGPGLYRELERTQSAMLSRFVFVTGDVLGAEALSLLSERSVPRITKPFALDEITGIMRKLLGTNAVVRSPKEELVQGDQPASGPRILIVDDDQNSQETAAEVLNRQGFEVLEARDGYEALSMARHSAPSAVVLDIMMPRLGGLQTLSLLRAIIPEAMFVILTGTFDGELQRRATESGAHAVLLKPVAWPTLAGILRGAPSRVTPVPSTRRAAAPTGRRVLVVDDEIGFLTAVEEILRAGAYEVHTAVDGARGFRAVIEWAPDVVLLDINMPGLSGLEALQAIHSTAPDVKVIMVSGISDEGDIKGALCNGAFDYVTKPLDFEYLRRSIELALAMKGAESS